MIPLKKKAMQVTDSIKMRIIFLILPVLCLLGEVHRNERKKIDPFMDFDQKYKFLHRSE